MVPPLPAAPSELLTTAAAALATAFPCQGPPLPGLIPPAGCPSFCRFT